MEKPSQRLPIVLVERQEPMKKQIVEALESIIISDLRQAYIHLDDVQFKEVLDTIKEVIQSYEDVELKNVPKAITARL